MKRFLFGIVLGLGLATQSFADPITRSSYTQTSDTAYIAAQKLTAVIVSSAGITGNLKIYNSTHTTANQIANIHLMTLGEYHFEDAHVKGIYYVISGNTAAGVTILYKQ